MYIEEIKSLLPHRYPFLLVDRVLEILPGESAIAIKNITANEPQFTGHFPHQSIMPGVFMIEAIAQVAAILGAKTINPTTETWYLTGVDKTRIKRRVVPGDQLRMEVKLLKSRRNIHIYAGKAYVDSHLCISTELICSTATRKEK